MLGRPSAVRRLPAPRSAGSPRAGAEANIDRQDAALAAALAATPPRRSSSCRCPGRPMGLACSAACWRPRCPRWSSTTWRRASRAAAARGGAGDPCRPARRALPLGRRRRPGRRPCRGAARPAGGPASPWCRTASRCRRRTRPAAPRPARGSAAGSAWRRRRSCWSSPAGWRPEGRRPAAGIAERLEAACGATLAALGEGSLRAPLAASRGRPARRPAAAARPCA